MPTTARSGRSISRASTSRCRGPLNTVRSPQGKPVFVQAGGSPRGRAFAAKHADSIIATANGIDGMKQYRDDVRRHAVSFGRNPDDIKVLFLVYPILAETDEEARGQAPAHGVVAALHRACAGQHGDSHRHRFLQIRPRPAVAAADDQWRAGFARQVRPVGQRQDAAPACDGAVRRAPVRGRFRRLAGHGGRAHGQRQWRRSAATGS